MFHMLLTSGIKKPFSTLIRVFLTKLQRCLLYGIRLSINYSIHPLSSSLETGGTSLQFLPYTTRANRTIINRDGANNIFSVSDKTLIINAFMTTSFSCCKDNDLSCNSKKRNPIIQHLSMRQQIRDHRRE